MKNLSAIILTTIGASAQTTWHVDVHGIAPGTGTVSDPYTSIQQALDAASTAPGDMLLVQPGVYREHLRFDEAVQLVSVAGPMATVITTDGPPATVHGYSNGASIEGFTIGKTTAAAPNSRVLDLSGLSLSKCIILGTPQINGIFFDVGYVDRCLITQCRDPLTFAPHSDGEIRNTIVWGNDFGFLVGPSPSVEVEYCVVTEVVSGGSPTNFASPPLVRSFTGHDFNLRSTSPCIDAGNPSSALDPDGSRADIGPLPFDPSYAPWTAYCTAKTNSLGCVPAIEASGNASATASVPFDIACTNELNQRLGLLFYGFAPKNAAYQGGYLCVEAPVRRTALLDSGGNVGGDDCSGVYSFDFNALIRAGSDPLLEAGTEVYAQFWSRDSAASFTTSRSDALRFGIAP